MPNKVNISELSDYLIFKFQNDGIPLTPLKLQKLLYYLQAWHTVFFDKHPLFEEKPEAWSNGPVYRSIYDRYKANWLRNTPISFKYESSGELLEKLKESFNKLKLEDQQIKFLEALLNKYGFLSPEKLVFLTHSESPWNEAREGYGPFDKCNETISIESMYQYYSNRIVEKK